MPDLTPTPPAQVVTRQGDVIDRFLSRYNERHTRTAYETDVRQFFRLVTDSDWIVDGDVERAFAVPELAGEHFQGRTWKPATTRRKIAALHTFFDWYAHQRRVHGLNNPFHRMNVARPALNGSDEPKGFFKADYRKLLAFASAGPHKLRNQALVSIGVSAALRKSELLSLIPEAVTMYAGKPYVKIGKSKAGSGNTSVRISAAAYEAVCKYREAYGLTGRRPLWAAMKEEMRRRGGNWAKPAYHEEGTPLGVDQLQDLMRRLVLGAGLDQAFTNLHVLRHTFGHIAAEADENPKRVQKHMRHKKIETTMIYYRLYEAHASGLVDGMPV